MSVPHYVDDRLAPVLKCWHPAPGGRPGTVAFTGQLFFADGDGVRVLIRISGDDALVSDGGVAAVRLDDAGIDIHGETRAAAAWAQILAEFGLREADGRIVGRRPVSQVEQLASDVASAMLTADGLRWLAPPPRENKLTRQLYDFLAEGSYKFDRRPTITLPRGSTVRPTAAVKATGRDVFIQAVGNGEQGIEHATSLVQRIGRAEYALNQRLVLLRGTPEDWSADHLDLLADHTPVAFSTRMDRLAAFLREGVMPPSPVERA